MNKLPRDEFLRRSSNGGKKGAETKKRRRECAEVLKLLLDKVYKDKNGAKADGREVLMVSLFNKAVKKQDVYATRLILDLIGEMPKNEINIRSGSNDADNGILEDLLQANLEIQKQIMGETNNGEQARTEHSNEDC